MELRVSTKEKLMENLMLVLVLDSFERQIHTHEQPYTYSRSSKM